MTRQEKVGYPLLDGVLVLAVPAHQLPLRHLRLDQQFVQIPQHSFVGTKLLRRRRLVRQVRKAQLILGESAFSQHPRNRFPQGTCTYIYEHAHASLTSRAVIFSAAQSSRGSTFVSNSRFGAMLSSCTSSASLGCSGNEAVVDLHALTAQVRKLRLRIFILMDL